MTSLSMRSIRLRPGEEYRDTIPVELEPLELGGQRYVPVPDAPEAEVTISRLGSGTLFGLRFETVLEGPCFRCLEEASLPLSVAGREYQAATDADSDEVRNPYLVDGLLELSAWARDAVALELPEKILCAEDCAGLCAGCGANLNVAECTCAPAEPDPRFAKLAELRERLRDA
jgi:uncharacterized protein